MTLFRRRKNPTSTRIVRRVEPVTAASAPEVTHHVRTAGTSVLTTQRWEPVRGEFRGFDSPPSKF